MRLHAKNQKPFLSYKIFFETFELDPKKFDLHKTACHSAKSVQSSFCPALTGLALDQHVNFAMFVCIFVYPVFFKASY